MKYIAELVHALLITLLPYLSHCHSVFFLLRILPIFYSFILAYSAIPSSPHLFITLALYPLYSGLDSIVASLEQELFMNFLALGELGLVSVLSFEAVVREDTAEYTCTASNMLPQTTTLENTSSPISLTVLGKVNCVDAYITNIYMQLNL